MNRNLRRRYRETKDSYQKASQTELKSLKNLEIEATPGAQMWTSSQNFEKYGASIIKLLAIAYCLNDAIQDVLKQINKLGAIIAIVIYTPLQLG
ncbi:hypothetical protein S1OALGB6SA_1864 [Olavius algarvensis spirochete endosymbiont]|uniref:hypothetical protein n=1 Tax=Olavius algarvensis spirochete endosymbiont TaxID=260710 RepID=UPI000F2CA2A8|nr:hypothetical protein [Olavius algarvensis spirochete endosymbiont]VDB00774.1 hypothetical protein S1OALGB6SA_1864 [Olavius algarvensis spirochete endosymbiont]